MSSELTALCFGYGTISFFWLMLMILPPMDQRMSWDIPPLPFVLYFALLWPVWMVRQIFWNKF